jgi:Caspase domain
MSRDALVVGINKYPFLKDSTGSYKHLTTPASDAEAIAQLLEADGHFRVQRLPKLEIDGKIQVDPNGRVSREELSQEINKLFCADNNRDTALLFFAGHGLQQLNSLSNKRKILLATSDTKGTGENGISLNDLWELLEESPVKEQIVWLDSCYCGEILEFKESDLAGRISGHRRFIIAASHSSEVAYERLDGKHGVLSGALIEGLNPNKIPEDDWITDRKLGDFVERELQKYYEQTKIPQIPQIRRPDYPVKLILGKGEKHEELEGIRRSLSRSCALSPFLSWEDFFHEWLNTEKTFNHAWQLVGRADYLQSFNDFLQSEEQKILILPGRGGIGKTKLLHAFAEQFNNSNLTLRFVEEGIPITEENVIKLPKNNSVLVLDDGHRREQDINILLAFLRRNPTNKLIVSCRPSGMEYLQIMFRQSGIDSRQIKRLDELKELSSDEVKALASQVLGNKYVHLVNKLALVTKDCPLVTVVGGRLLSQKVVHPSLLERDADFQYDVLSRFHDALIGKVSPSIEPELCQKLLKLIAAVAPIRLNNEEFKQLAAEFLKVERSKLVSSIDILETSGILLPRGYTLRITPDVLADHILHRACLTCQGESTGYAQEIFHKFKSVSLKELMKNLAEVDWRISHTNREESDLLTDIWCYIYEDFRKASNSNRHYLLKLLTEVAYYQPKQMLELGKLAMHPATTPEDERFSDFNYYDTVLNQLPEIFKRVSYTLNYLLPCCNILWELGQDDSRGRYSRYRHPIDVLIELAKYDIDKEMKFNLTVLEAVKRWLKKTDAHSHIHSPLDILDTFLIKNENSTSMSGSSLVVHYFAVDSHKTQNIREQVLALISDCLKSNQPKIVLRALKSLAKALEEPVDRLSGEKNCEQCEKWLPEQLKILELISALVYQNKQALISLKVINILNWYIHLGYSAIVRKKALEIIHLITDTFELRLIGVLAYIGELDWLINNKGKIDFLSFQSNWQEREKRVDELSMNVVQEFLRRYPDAHSGVQLLDKELTIIQDSGLKNRTGLLFLDALLKIEQADYIAKMCKAIVEVPESPFAKNIAYLLCKLRKLDVSRAINITQLAVNTDCLNLCSSIAEKFWTWGDNFQKIDVDIIQKLLSHNEMEVKKCAIASLYMMISSQPKLVTAMALNVEIGNSRELAIKLCKLFSSTYGISLNSLSDDELEMLLAKLEPVTDISNYQITEFIVDCFKLKARLTLQLLLKRIKHDDKNYDINYHSLPYTEFPQKLDDLAESQEYEDLILDILKHALNPLNREFVLPELFKKISLDFSSKSLKVLDEWINSQEPEQLLAASYLLRNAPKSFFIKHLEFVSNLLERADELGDACYQAVCDDLQKSFSMSEYFGILGEALSENENITLQKQIANIAEQFIVGTPSHKFYESLSKNIRESNKYWRKSWEEIND